LPKLCKPKRSHPHGLRPAVTHEKWHCELIRLAEEGEAYAGREILETIAESIDAGKLDVLLFRFLADKLWLYLQDGVPLERALGVEEFSQGGRKPHYSAIEILAVDTLLGQNGFSKERAIEWIEEYMGASRTTVQNIRRDLKFTRDFDKRALLALAGSHRAVVAGILLKNSD